MRYLLLGLLALSTTALHAQTSAAVQAQTQAPAARKNVPFVLHNNSLHSIPLVIPGVMNPNLSPLSASSVSLCIGQEVYFRYRGRDELLFTVDEKLQPGTKVQVARLIRERKKQLP